MKRRVSTGSRAKGAGAPRAERPPDDPAAAALRELRSAVANLRAAAEALDSSGPLPDRRQRALLAAMLDEAGRASRSLDEVGRLAEAPSPRARPTARADALVAEVERRALAEHGLALEIVESVDDRVAIVPELSAAILRTLGRLRRDVGVGEGRMISRRHDSLVSIELVFAALVPESTRLVEEHAAVLAGGGRGAPALGDAARAAGGEAWLAIRRGEPTFSLRILLPRA